MIVARFNHAGDLKILNSWLAKRNHPLALSHDLPKKGYMVFDEETPVCCAFLRLCEGNFGILDGLATNPEIEGKKRNIAIDIVVQIIIAEAKRLRMNNLMAWSQDASTLLRSAKHGFEKTPFSLITKSLLEERGLTQ